MIICIFSFSKSSGLIVGTWLFRLSGRKWRLPLLRLCFTILAVSGFGSLHLFLIIKLSFTATKESSFTDAIVTVMDPA